MSVAAINQNYVFVMWCLHTKNCRICYHQTWLFGVAIGSNVESLCFLPIGWSLWYQN